MMQERTALEGIKPFIHESKRLGQFIAWNGKQLGVFMKPSEAIKHFMAGQSKVAPESRH